jgi:hypothetical protein
LIHFGIGFLWKLLWKKRGGLSQKPIIYSKINHFPLPATSLKPLKKKDYLKKSPFRPAPGRNLPLNESFGGFSTGRDCFHVSCCRLTMLFQPIVGLAIERKFLLLVFKTTAMFVSEIEVGRGGEPGVKHLVIENIIHNKFRDPRPIEPAGDGNGMVGGIEVAQDPPAFLEAPTDVQLGERSGKVILVEALIEHSQVETLSFRRSKQLAASPRPDFQRLLFDGL